MKTHKVASLVLAGAMAATMLTSLAAKKDDFTPDTAAQRMEQEFVTAVEKTAKSLEDSDLSSFKEADLYDLMDWVETLGIVYEAAAISLEDAKTADENRNETYSEKFADGVSTVTTKATNDYLIYSEKEEYNDKTSWEYKVSFMRKLNRMSVESYGVAGEQKTLDALLDYVAGEERVYLQFGLYIDEDKDTGLGVYSVVRAMVGNGEVYASITEMDEKELLASRVVGVYPDFAAFAFKDGEHFAYNGKTVAITDEDGIVTSFQLDSRQAA